MIYSAKQLADILHTTCIIGCDAHIEYLVTDSRRLNFPASSLFVALKTRKRDGHEFINELYERGVRNFLVHNGFNCTIYENANFIFSEDTLKSLHQIAAYHRSRFSYPVIGITGSNGKTVVKEWLYQLLQTDYTIVRSPRSYNSQIGVPLSVWQMSYENNLAIFEAGISQPGEMDALQDIIKPTIGVLTNIGAAHAENFVSDEEKTNEKIKLFTSCEIVICNADSDSFNNIIQQKVLNLLTWSFNNNGNILIKNINKKNGITSFDFIIKEQKYAATIPFSDDASMWNAATCIAVLAYLKVPAHLISQKLALLSTVQMRMQLQPAINNCSVINDSYSFDIGSFAIALDFLTNQNQFEHKTVIISDMPFNENLKSYYEIISMLLSKKIKRLIAIGMHWSDFFEANKFSEINVQVYQNTKSFLQNFSASNFKNEAILLKGARIFEFEKIASALQKKVHQTTLEINLSAMAHNLSVYRSTLNAGTKIMAMVKAGGYGSGSAEVANLLQFHKIDYLAVAYADEGVELRKAGIYLPIMVMNIDEAAFEILVEYNLEPELFSTHIFNAFINFLDTQGLENYPVHIKIDTGMHRLGFEDESIEQLLHYLQKAKHVHIKSVFSHLASSDDAADDEFTLQQAEKFKLACNKIYDAVKYNFIKHISNSAAIFRLPQLQFDMIRLGIGLYGVDSSKHHQHLLQTVLTLKTTVAQIRNVKAGETIGYNRKGKVSKNAVIATLRIGYADGFRRSLSNGIGKVFIKGQLAPVIGTVAMDMMMVDITGIENINVGDEVEIFGNNISIQQFASWCNTIPYEIFTGISQRVKRIYIEE